MTTGRSDDSAVPLEVDCIGGGRCYVGHGVDVVLIATTEDVKFWRNSFWLTPEAARDLAAILIEQADAAATLTGSSPAGEVDRG